jgi:hypothetical protein
VLDFHDKKPTKILAKICVHAISIKTRVQNVEIYLPDKDLLKSMIIPG